MGNNVSHTYPQNVPISKETDPLCRVAAYFRKLADEDEVSTVYEAFQRGQMRSSNGPFLGRRTDADAPYEWISYAAVSDMADAFGAGLINECGLKPENDTCVGLFALNRVEWVVTDQACARYSMVTIPLNNGLDKDSIRHIMHETKLKLVVVDTLEKVVQLVEMAGELSKLHSIVLMEGDVEDELKGRLEDVGWKLHSFSELVESGKNSPRELQPAKPDDIYTICFTNGTTGVPKGVVITNKAIAHSGMHVLGSMENTGIGIRPPDVFFSYLPLANFYERLTLFVVTYYGCRTAFHFGDISRLFDDCRAAQPTVFTAVPRALNRAYDMIHSTSTKSCFQRMWLRRAARNSQEDMQRGVLRSGDHWDRSTFAEVRAMFGGRVRHINVVGGAVYPQILNFFRAALGCSITLSYGLTETLVVTTSHPYDFRGDHVGGPIQGIEIKLIDAPESGYSVEKGVGEICIRGPTTFQEYYKDKERSKETVDDDGWIHTGDIGTWTWQGNLKVIDRCKHLVKLSEGEHISPSKLEGIYERCPLVSHVHVDGNSDKDYLVAVVVPNFEDISVTRGKEEEDKEEICKNEEVRQLILSEMRSFGRENGLRGRELVRKIHLYPEEFCAESELIKISVNSRRHNLREKFVDFIKSLYDEL